MIMMVFFLDYDDKWDDLSDLQTVDTFIGNYDDDDEDQDYPLLRFYGGDGDDDCDIHPPDRLLLRHLQTFVHKSRQSSGLGNSDIGAL